MPETWDGFSRRTPFSVLPASVVDELQVREASELSDARTRIGGYSSGVACLLRRQDGTEIFLKALPVDNEMVGAYRSEARIAPQLPSAVRAPRLRHSFERDGWIVLVFDAISGECPRTWDDRSLEALLVTLDVNAKALSPNPITGLAGAAEDLRDDFGMWTKANSGEIEIPAVVDVSRLAQLEENWGQAIEGDSTIHLDVRADNVVIDSTGTAWLVDWSWPAIGAAWVDLAVFLPTTALSTDRLDAIFANHPLGSDLPGEQLDTLLASLSGFWLWNATKPELEHATGLRSHQRRCGSLCLDWLRYRGAIA